MSGRVADFYSAVAPPAMRLVIACFQGAFSWLCRFWLALGASYFALAGQPSRYLFLVPFAQRHSTRFWCYIFWLLPRRFAMPPRLQGALLPYAASFLWYWFGDPAFGPPAIDCEPCHEVWPVRVLYFWLLPRRFAHGPSPSGHAASTTFSGTGIPPSAQLSTLRRALLPLPRCLDALRILFSCCSMALFLVTPAVWGYGLWPPSDRLRAAIGPFFVPAPAVNLWILIALARRGCPCRFRVATGRYAWLRRTALLPRLCRGCGLVCMEVCYTYLCSLFWQIFCLSTDWKALNWRDDG
jgi:hypothetical protein